MSGALGDHPLARQFNALDPLQILDAIQLPGWFPTGRVMALNSYENRVYQIELEDADGALRTVVGNFYRLGRWSADARNQRAAADRAALRRAWAIRPFLDCAYAPAPEILAPEGDTIVCRCEEITAAQIRQSYAEGAIGPRQVKTATRAGMGHCQGRMCDLTTRGILASCGAAPAAPRARSPIKPVTLGELAALAAHQETSS